MPLTHDSIATIFAPLATDNQAPFFQHLSPEIVWKYTGSHPLAGKYEGLPAVAAGTFAKLHGCFAGESFELLFGSTTRVEGGDRDWLLWRVGGVLAEVDLPG